MAADEALNDQQLRFCREFAADPSNATKAYQRAYPGSSYNTARVNASLLLSKANIQAELDAARKEYARKCRISFARVVREIAGIALADPDDLFEEGPDGNPQLRPWSEISPAARRTIERIKIKRRRLAGGGGKDDVTAWEVEDIEVKQHSKDAALDKLCRHLGITRDGAGLEKLLEMIDAQKPDPGAVRPHPGAGGESPPSPPAPLV